MKPDKITKNKLEKVEKLVNKYKKELKGYEQDWDINVGNLLIKFTEEYNEIWTSKSQEKTK